MVKPERPIGHKRRASSCHIIRIVVDAYFLIFIAGSKACCSTLITLTTYLSPLYPQFIWRLGYMLHAFVETSMNHTQAYISSLIIWFLPLHLFYLSYTNQTAQYLLDPLAELWNVSRIDTESPKLKPSKHDKKGPVQETTTVIVNKVWLLQQLG